MKKHPSKHPPTLLIDGDILAFKATAAATHNITFDGDNYIPVSSLEKAGAIFDDTLASLLSGFKTSHYVIAMTDAVNFRHTVYPPYKSNRKGKQRPPCLAALRERINHHHPVFQRPTLEADDILGILATSATIIKQPGEKIIVSADKDMKSIPGLFYDLGPREVYEISEQEADHWHMTQTLIGDTADGYPGCPGIGPVKAERILDQGGTVAEWWPLVVSAYEKAGLTVDDALVQAQVSRICRVQDYDFKQKEVKLWKPSNMTAANPVMI